MKLFEKALCIIALFLVCLNYSCSKVELNDENEDFLNGYWLNEKNTEEKLVNGNDYGIYWLFFYNYDNNKYASWKLAGYGEMIDKEGFYEINEDKIYIYEKNKSNADPDIILQIKQLNKKENLKATIRMNGKKETKNFLWTELYFD